MIVRFFERPFFYLVLFTMGAFLQGCMKDDCEESTTAKAYVPVYSSYDNFRSDIRPEAPRSICEPGKIHSKGNYLLVNEPNQGIHVIDNSDPASPTNVAFIPIPGNIDMAVRQNTLYADSYTDLVVMDLSDPTQPDLVNRYKDVFPYDPYQYTPYEGKYVRDVDPSKGIVVDWKLKEVEAERPCASSRSGRRREPFFHRSDLENSTSPVSETTYSYSSGGSTKENTMSKAGSMSRFALSHSDHLYTVKGNELAVFDLAQPRSPDRVNTKTIDHNIETIFSYKENLFIGANDGVHIYDNSSPSYPSAVATYRHVEQCDPVVVKGDYAYVTLRSGTQCGGYVNELQVIDIADPSNPHEERSYDMRNPRGLDISDSKLFVCDGEEGLVEYDASNTPDLSESNQVGGIEGYDVIALPQTLIVVGENGIHQYDRDQGLQKLSSISATGC